MLSTKLQKIRELALTKEGDCFKKCPYKDSECLETCLQVLQKLILEIIDNESENIIGDITENNTIEKSGMSQKINEIIEKESFSTLDEFKEIISKELDIDVEDIIVKRDGNGNLIVSAIDYIDTIITPIIIE